MTDSPANLAVKAELLELLLNATQDGIVDWNLVDGTADYNPRWQLMLGFDNGEFSHGQMSPELWQELIHPDERGATLQLLMDHLDQDWPFNPTVRMRHRSAGYRHILCRGTALRDANLKPLRMVIIFSDIDDKIRGEERQRALMAALPDTLFRLRASGTISGVKRGREREGSPFASLREGSVLADNFPDPRTIAPLQAALASSAVDQAQSARTVKLCSTTAEGGSIHHEVRVLRSGDDEVVCIVRDVTEQFELEQRLLETQKLGAIGQLAAGVAHEINTPMQFIGDSLHFARASIGDLVVMFERFKAATADAEQAPLGSKRLAELRQVEQDADFDYARQALPEAIDRALAGVARVSKIVQAMKSFSHPGRDELAPTELKGLIENTVVVATNEWKYVADVEVDCQPGLPLVPCIAGELNQVVLNLLVNAAHAIGDVVGTSGNKGRIKVTATSDPTHAEIRIADTGSGIPEKARAKVFEPFFTTKEVGKGTGQGLSMAYNCIVKRHRGTINFETELGVGTTFIVRLPLEVRITRTSAPA
jgi:signal transduction histidine kinase